MITFISDSSHKLLNDNELNHVKLLNNFQFLNCISLLISDWLKFLLIFIGPIPDFLPVGVRDRLKGLYA